MTTIKHVVRPQDVEREGRWVREWSVYALRETGAVEVAQCVPSRAKARKIAAVLSAEPVTVRGVEYASAADAASAAEEHDAPPAPRSYRPEFLVAGEWCANAQRFATHEEADNSARARFQAWTIPTDCRAVASDDPVNYARVEGRDVAKEPTP